MSPSFCCQLVYIADETIMLAGDAYVSTDCIVLRWIAHPGCCDNLANRVVGTGWFETIAMAAWQFQRSGSERLRSVLALRCTDSLVVVLFFCHATHIDTFTRMYLVHVSVCR